ncbi:MAG TPA: peptidylprolyl isomerase [Blastocatellia bacterium]|nr:peptidylprolyl isomerase [Blastocatellia bacterium]
MKTSSLIFICLFLIVFNVCSSADERSKRSGATISPNVHARIIQLEDERNLAGDELTGLLKHKTPEVRERAALAIGRIGDKRGTAPLINVLQRDESSLVRAMAAFALGEIEDVRAANALLDALNSSKESLSVRARAVEALGKIVGVQANAESLGQPTLDSINQSLVKQLPAVSGALSADQKLLSSLTITALARLRNPASIEPLSQQLKSNDADFRAQAANALARLRQPIDNAVMPLIEALQEQEISATVKSTESLTNNRADARANAARALGVSKDSRAVEPLLKALYDKSEHAQVDAVRALAVIGDRRAVEPLIELTKLNDPKSQLLRERPPSFNLMLECVVALGALKDERALPSLGELRRTYAPAAIQEVEIAIARFGERWFSEIPLSPAGQRDLACRDWQRAAATALAISEWLPTKNGNVWERAFYDLLFGMMPRINNPACDQRSTPEAMRAIDKLWQNYLDEPSFAQSFKSRDVASSDKPIDLYLSFFPQQLKEKDVIVRATAANILAGQPREAHLTPLLDALAQSKNDSANDAKLAILTALSKHKKPEAIEAIKSALTDKDHLVRRHTVNLLKQMGAGDHSDRIGIVQTGHDKRFYQSVAARLNKRITATIHTAKGPIRIELFPKDAPITVDSFITLARKGYFNNLKFHRVVPNFVIQGGDPRGDGEGGPGYQIRCEINTRPYIHGAVGMALSGKDTGGSQFFITHTPQPHLDGGYTVFGQVVSGLEVVDRISRDDVIRRVEIIETR